LRSTGHQGRAGRRRDDADINGSRRTQDHSGGQWARVISKALDRWAYENGVTLDFSRPGKPTDNAFVALKKRGRLKCRALAVWCRVYQYEDQTEDEALAAWEQSMDRLLTRTSSCGSLSAPHSRRRDAPLVPSPRCRPDLE
jgi:transposase InsO family protein